jgi:hypothetical protein
MRALLKDVADDQFAFDAKLPRTLHALFLRPGLLTADYMAGRAARYIPPFRLYLLASLLFFVLLSFFNSRSEWTEVAGRQLEPGRAAAEPAEPASGERPLSVGVTVGGRPVGEGASVDIPWDWLDRRVENNLRALGELPADEARRRASSAILEQLPKVMFLLLPVFALLLELFYIRRRRFYIEHFVFALHVHAFAFLLFVTGLFYRSQWLQLVLILGFGGYLLLAMKRVYGQGWPTTVGKWLLLSLAYLVLLSFGASLAAVAGLALAAPAAY